MIRKVLFATTAVLALIGLAAAPSAAQYGPDGPTLSVSTEQVAQGSTLTLTGTGFAPDTTYEIGTIYYGTTAEAGSPDNSRALAEAEGNENLGTVTTDAAGSFTKAVSIASDAKLGLYVLGIDTIITAFEDGYTSIDTVEYEVVAAPVAVPASTNSTGSASSSGGGTLARTGSTTLPLVGAGLGLLAAGGALLFVNKRRSIV